MGETADPDPPRAAGSVMTLVTPAAASSGLRENKACLRTSRIVCQRRLIHIQSEVLQLQ